MTFRKSGTYSLKVLRWKMLILEIHVLKFLSVTNFSNTFIVVRASSSSQWSIFEILWSVILQLAFLKLWAKSSSPGKLGWQIVKGMKGNKRALRFWVGGGGNFRTSYRFCDIAYWLGIFEIFWVFRSKITLLKNSIYIRAKSKVSVCDGTLCSSDKDARFFEEDIAIHS